MRSRNPWKWKTLLVASGLLLSGHGMAQETPIDVMTRTGDRTALYQINLLLRQMGYADPTVKLVQSEPTKIFEIRTVPKAPITGLMAKAEEAECGYLIRSAYELMGYSGASVKPIQSDPTRRFEVRPGSMYRLKDLQILGLRRFPVSDLLQEAPRPGEVYSPTRINKWVESIRKKYADAEGPLRLVSQSVALDRAHATVSVTLVVEETR